MIARAPGKLVLSGAYSVLEGAPAIVAAVDRYAVADSTRASDRVTPEVQAAIDAGLLDRAPWFDASALRSADGSRKLGLGSSAAILVASLGARSGSIDEQTTRAIFAGALAAHRAAQGGGSGVDVAASAFGGVLACTLASGSLNVAPITLPAGLAFAVFVSRTAASTPAFVGKVKALASSDPTAFRRLIDAASAGARAATVAISIADFVAAIEAQVIALADLGVAAGVPIVTADLASLRPIAANERGVLSPSGAGGGDVAFFAGPRPPSPELLRAVTAAGLEPLPLALGARGVHLTLG